MDILQVPYKSIKHIIPNNKSIYTLHITYNTHVIEV